jgi:hypothetical protein
MTPCSVLTPPWWLPAGSNGANIVPDKASPASQSSSVSIEVLNILEEIERKRMRFGLDWIVMWWVLGGKWERLNLLEVPLHVPHHMAAPSSLRHSKFVIATQMQASSSNLRDTFTVHVFFFREVLPDHWGFFTPFRAGGGGASWIGRISSRIFIWKCGITIWRCIADMVIVSVGRRAVGMYVKGWLFWTQSWSIENRY